MSPEPFERLLEATQPDFEAHVLRHPLLLALMKGELRRDHYAVFLRETFHLVRHTSRALATAAARLGDEHRGLRGWLLEQAHEEHGHELFCIKDLRNLGLDPDSVLSAPPGPGAWGMVTQNYFLAVHSRPGAILGVAAATEGMGVQLADSMADAVSAQLGIPDTATTFLRSHASFDARHFEEARRAVNSYAQAQDTLDEVIRARRYTFRYYGELYSDVLNAVERYFPADRHAA
ncbi:MAG: TenA family transcriptional regulator [Solimonas sp.]